MAALMILFCSSNSCRLTWFEVLLSSSSKVICYGLQHLLIFSKSSYRTMSVYRDKHKRRKLDAITSPNITQVQVVAIRQFFEAKLSKFLLRYSPCCHFALTWFCIQFDFQKGLIKLQNRSITCAFDASRYTYKNLLKSSINVTTK